MNSIRNLRPNELERINEIDNQAFPDDGYNLLTLHQFYDLFPSLFRVIVVDEVVAGFCIGARDECSDSWMIALAIEMDYQGKGLGKLLAIDFCSRSDDDGIRRSYLTVDPENARAVRLYEGLGFQQIKLVRDYYGNGEDRALMYRDGTPAM